MKISTPFLSSFALVLWRVMKYAAIGAWMLTGFFFSLFFALLSGGGASAQHDVPLEHTRGGIRIR